MTDITSGALPGLRAGSFTLRPAGPGTGFGTKNLIGMTAAPLTDPWSGEDDTDYDYYATPSGNLWRPGDEPGQPSGAEPGRPDTGSYEVIHLGGPAAVVVPVTYFLRLRALELHASAEELQDAEDAAAPARSPAAKRRPGSDRPGRGASLSFPDRPPVASPPRARTRMP
jgi:hypothetical protein